MKIQKLFTTFIDIPSWPARQAQLTLCIAGFLISAYSLYVKTRVSLEPHSYRALCDLAEHVSCSKVLASKYSQGFGVPSVFPEATSHLNVSNCIVGIIFYVILFGITCAWDRDWALKASVGLCSLATISCLYLAFILIFILVEFCLVCVSTYVINVALLRNSLQKYKLISSNKNASVSIQMSKPK